MVPPLFNKDLPPLLSLACRCRMLQAFLIERSQRNQNYQIRTWESLAFANVQCNWIQVTYIFGSDCCDCPCKTLKSMQCRMSSSGFLRFGWLFHLKVQTKISINKVKKSCFKKSKCRFPYNDFGVAMRYGNLSANNKQIQRCTKNDIIYCMA